MAIAVEAILPKTDLKPALARGCMTIWQGLWFIQIGVVNWPMPLLGDLLVWTETNSHANVMLTDTIFVGHLLSIIAFTLLSGIAIHCRVARKFKKTAQYGTRNASNNNYKMLPENEDTMLMSEECLMSA